MLATTTASSVAALSVLPTSIPSKKSSAAQLAATFAPLAALPPVIGLDVPSVIPSIAAPSTPANNNKDYHESLALIRSDVQMLLLSVSSVRIELLQQLLYMRYLCFGLVVYAIVLLFKLSNRVDI